MSDIPLTNKEEQAIKAVLLKSIHKVAKRVKEGHLVWIPEYRDIVEESSDEYPIWLWIDKIQYTHDDEWFPTIEIYCSYFRKNKFKSSFYMNHPPAKFNDQTPIPHEIMVLKFSYYDEDMDREVWEQI